MRDEHRSITSRTDSIHLPQLFPDLGSISDVVYGAVGDAQGNLILAGREGGYIGTWRLRGADGALDTLFGDNHDGKELIDLGEDDYAYGAAVD
jgi:hypothetical protein